VRTARLALESNIRSLIHGREANDAAVLISHLDASRILFDPPPSGGCGRVRTAGCCSGCKTASGFCCTSRRRRSGRSASILRHALRQHVNNFPGSGFRALFVGSRARRESIVASVQESIDAGPVVETRDLRRRATAGRPLRCSRDQQHEFRFVMGVARLRRGEARSKNLFSRFREIRPVGSEEPAPRDPFRSQRPAPQGRAQSA